MSEINDTSNTSNTDTGYWLSWFLWNPFSSSGSTDSSDSSNDSETTEETQSYFNSENMCSESWVWNLDDIGLSIDKNKGCIEYSVDSFKQLVNHFKGSKLNNIEHQFKIDLLRISDVKIDKNKYESTCENRHDIVSDHLQKFNKYQILNTDMNLESFLQILFSQTILSKSWEILKNEYPENHIVANNESYIVDFFDYGSDYTFISSKKFMKYSSDMTLEDNILTHSTIKFTLSETEDTCNIRKFFIQYASC